MANTNPQAVNISDTKIRPLADALAQVYHQAKLIGELSTAQNWNSIIPNDSTVMGDSAATDGRPIVTNGQLQVVLSHAAALVTDFQASTNLKLNQILSVAVNPSK